ncbi:MAG: peptide chain release factor N(5)-glutamine methyltransferase [Elusimicrobia bacterium]|nr:peptide chain release factor N(5)-glutamine methyltransferase [Elusimicrobiota bacterium]
MRIKDCFRSLRGEFPEICGEDFEYIFAKTAGLDYGVAFVSDGDISSEKISEIKEKLEERKTGKPVEYIFKSARFMGFDFEISEGIFIPRNATEILVGEVLKEVEDAFRLADVGCGSGVIGIVLAKMKKLEVFATDIDERAVELTKKNADRLGVLVEAVRGDLFEKLSGKFDIIVSNPPYVSEGDVLPEEVLRENEISLFSGGEGLDCIRRIVAESGEYLKSGGFLFLEIGFGQSDKVKDLMKENDFCEVRDIRDLSGIPRVIRGRFAG